MIFPFDQVAGPGVPLDEHGRHGHALASADQAKAKGLLNVGRAPAIRPEPVEQLLGAGVRPLLQFLQLADAEAEIPRLVKDQPDLGRSAHQALSVRTTGPSLTSVTEAVARVLRAPVTPNSVSLNAPV